VRLRWSTVPRLAAIDIVDAWLFGHRDAGARRAIRLAYGPQPLLMSVALGVACAGIASYVETLTPGDWFSFGQTGFAAVVGQRGWRALREAAAPDQVIRPLLVTALPGIAALVLTQVALGLWGAPEAWSGDGVVVEALISVIGQGTWALVLLGALTASQRWLATLLELFVAWLVFFVSVGFARLLVELVGEVTLWVGGTVLGWLGLGALASLLELADDLADIGFVVGVLVWVGAAAWLTACEVLPRKVVGERISFVAALKEMLALRG